MDAYNYIKEAIVLGKYKPGMRLTEESLSKELNLSRTPVREAIRQLTAEGLVVQLKRGISVRNFKQEDIREIYNIRALLEGYAASEAAFHRTETHLEKLTEANDIYATSVERYNRANISTIKDIVEANQKFHEAILEAANNETLKFHLSRLVVVPLVFRSFYWFDERQLIRSLDAHRTILKAIKDQEFDRAKAAMHEHILQGRDHVLNHLDEIKVELTKDY